MSSLLIREPSVPIESIKQLGSIYGLSANSSKTQMQLTILYALCICEILASMTRMLQRVAENSIMCIWHNRNTPGYMMPDIIIRDIFSGMFYILPGGHGFIIPDAPFLDHQRDCSSDMIVV